MFTKVVAVVALLAVAYCQEHSHSYTLKSVVKHEEPKKVEAYHSVPLVYKSLSDSGSYGQGHGHAISSQSIIHHGQGHHESQDNGHNAHYVIPTHYQLAPVQQTVAIHSAPVYESHFSGQSHGHAVSSQSIVRHDSDHKESHGENQAHYIIPVHHEPAPVHETVRIHAAPVQIQTGEHKYGHAISSQNIVRHDSHQSQGNSGHYAPVEYHHVAPVQHALNIHAAPVQIQSDEHKYGHAVSSQNIVRHDSHQSQDNSGHYAPVEYHHVAPVQHTLNIHAAPVQIQSGEHKYGHAVSSQNIIRHDSHQSQGNSGHYSPIEYHHGAPVQHTLNIHAAPIQHHIVQESGHEESYEKEYYTHPKYEFEYKVEDPHTKDIKFQHEARDGDVVKGIYSLHEADGSIRTVKYSADKHSGFNAHVENSGASKHIEQQQQYHH